MTVARLNPAAVRLSRLLLHTSASRTAYDAAWWAEQQRKDRRFEIAIGISCAIIVLFFIALGWIIVAIEPERRAAYLARCPSAGLTPEQCKFFYAERSQQDADDAITIGLAATALSLAASRR
jgi:hypothetical protein